MAKSFKDTKGAAVKNDAYQFKDGEQSLRIFGGVLARYMYWLGPTGKQFPVECLSFNRDTEKFDKAEKDWVREFLPDEKCSWAYAVNCIDLADNKVKVLNLKKKLYEQIIDAAENLGDPTDENEGWDLVIKRTKTGPLNFNVAYGLNTFKCKKRSLTEDERALIAAAESIDTKLPRPTTDEVRKTMESFMRGDSGEQSEAEGEAVNELDK